MGSENKIIIAVDNGNSNLKTERCVFPAGFKMQETKPSELFAKDILEYNGKFYSLTSNTFPYTTNKTQDDNALILTFFGIAKEIAAREALKKPEYNFKTDFKGFIGKDITLAVGLPPAHFEKQGKAFKEYFEKASAHGVTFKYNDKPYSFYISKVYVFPQDFAAVIAENSSFLYDYTTVYCCDIGGGTTDLVGITEGAPDKDTIVSREIGINKLQSLIIDDVVNDYNVTLDNKTVDDFLRGKQLALAPEIANQIKSRIDETCKKFTSDLINTLHSKVPDFRVYPVIFCGGGSMMLKKYLEASGQFGITYFINNINANAVGYRVLAEMK